MNLRGNRLIKGLSAALAVIYALLAFYTATQAQASAWAVPLAVGPLVVAILLLARKNLGLGHFLPFLLAVLAGMVWAWPRLQQHLGWTYYLQHLGMMLFGAVAFGSSLAGGRTALCTTFASFAHETLSPALLRYTRRVTVAWTGFFVVMAIVSTLLFFSPLPRAVWSAFDTLLTLPMVGLMFVAEYAVRRRLLPQEPHMGVTGAYRAYLAYRARRAASSDAAGQPLAEQAKP